MNALKVKRLFDIKQQKKELETEEELLIKEFKDEMLLKNIRETVIGDYRLQLQCQDRGTYNRSIISFLKEKGYQDLIVETYDHDRLKQLEKQGVFDEKELGRHRLEKLVYYLFVKPC